MGLLPGRVNGRIEDSAEGILCSIWHGTGIPCSHIGSSCDIGNGCTDSIYDSDGSCGSQWILYAVPESE